ncbi:MAG: ABC transporter substrate-binding protein [Betaproteobacteria bacterium]
MMLRAVFLVLACTLVNDGAAAADGVRICLNWAPGADHAPIYFAREQGWFADAGVAVDILPGGSSADALKKLAADDCEAAIADYGALRAARAGGRDLVAAMRLMSDSPLAFYWLEGTPIGSPADLADKRIGAYATDPPRRLWPTFAARHGLVETAVTWVDLPNNAKVAALARGDVDVAANGFYHHHVEYAEAFGDRLRVMWWRDLGLNPTGNVLALARWWVTAHPGAAQAFVRALQRGYATCAGDGEPCLAALLAANPYLDPTREHAKWQVFVPLSAPGRLAGTTFGAFESPPGAAPDRSVADEMLDPGLKVPAAH